MNKQKIREFHLECNLYPFYVGVCSLLCNYYSNEKLVVSMNHLYFDKSGWKNSNSHKSIHLIGEKYGN